VRNDGDRPTGWLLPPNDPVALREALQRALDAPAEERRRRARAGAELVRERDAREGDRAWTALLDRLVVDAGLGSA
jgi:glycosyltransferase involved in cell wall biosynthesis